MITLLLTILFAVSAALAVASIAESLHRYGPAAFHLGQQARDCPKTSIVRWTVKHVEVRWQGATILRPDFAAARLADRVPHPALRVAA